jgi:FkbM family methyltransferase
MNESKYQQVDAKNGVFLLDLTDQVVSKSLLETGEWAADDLERILTFVDSSSDVLVVGAHIGSLAIPIAKRVNKMVAIEANPYTFSLLKRNIELNGLANVEAHEVAASDVFEKLCFLINTQNSGGTKRKPIITNEMYTYDNPEELLVNAVPLDNLLKDQVFDLIVMDIEGSEYYALKGMQNLLENTKALVIEFVPHHLKNVSNVSLEDFLSLLGAFDIMHLPSKKINVPSQHFLNVLQYLYDNDKSEDGLIFFKQQ